MRDVLSARVHDERAVDRRAFGQGKHRAAREPDVVAAREAGKEFDGALRAAVRVFLRFVNDVPDVEHLRQNDRRLRLRRRPVFLHPFLDRREIRLAVPELYIHLRKSDSEHEVCSTPVFRE